MVSEITRRITFFLLFAIVIFPIIIMYRESTVWWGQKPRYRYQLIQDANHTKHGPPQEKILLIHSTLFGNKEWGPQLREKDLPHILTRQGCRFTDCIVTYDKSLIRNSSVIVFHARDIRANDLRKISQTSRFSWQRWVYFSAESPINTNSPVPLNGLFNWTMTYKSDSDIWVPYSVYRELRPDEERPDAKINYAQHKDKFVAWMSSHCGELRDQVVKKLANLVNVEVGGGCAHQYAHKFQCSRKDPCSVLKRYKFYLAFENSFCKEYVTEKYWANALYNDAIPIVLGGGPYSDPKVGIPGSFINVADFDSITHLADYLKYLAANDTAFNEYFAWKQKYTIIPNYFWPYGSYWPCKACELLHKNTPDKVYHQLSDFWSIEDCRRGDRKIREIISRS